MTDQKDNNQNLYELSKTIKDSASRLEELYRQGKLEPQNMQKVLRDIYDMEGRLLERLYESKLPINVDDIKQGIYSQRKIIEGMLNEKNPGNFITKIDGSREYAEMLEKRLYNLKQRNYAIASLAISIPMLLFFLRNQELTARAISPPISSVSISFSIIIILLSGFLLFKDKIHSILKKVLQFSKRI